MIMQKHILLVEDDEAIREMVENYLTMEGSMSQPRSMVKTHYKIVCKIPLIWSS